MSDVIDSLGPPNEEAQRRSAAAVMMHVTRAAAVNGEGVLGYCRLFFCTAVLLRFLFIDAGIPAKAFVLNILTLVAGITFSVWVLWVRHRNQPFTTALRLGGVADALIAFGSLLQTALWNPEAHGYLGLLTVPDLSIVPLIVFAASFRLSPHLAGLSGLLNAFCLVALLTIDHMRFGDRLGYGTSQLSLFGLVFVTSVVASILMAARIRKLVVFAALNSMRIENARWTMSEMLREQHDTRSLLSSVNLNAQLICGVLQAGVATTDSRAIAWADSIRNDLAQVNARILEFGERTFAEFAALGEPELVDTRAVVPTVISLLAKRFGTSIECNLSELPLIHLAGGSVSLQRILYNLILNALEGDGTSGARRVWVSTQSVDDRFCLSVEDDGPGFSSDLLKNDMNCVSTKSAGTGLGLFGISQLLKSGGGCLSVRNRQPHGAVVTVTLPR